MATKEKVGPVLAAASEAWAKTLHPRPTDDEACAWMRAVFRGRHLCRAITCPRVCPRSPDHGMPAVPPAWSAEIPAMTAEEVAAVERGLGPLRALRAVVAVSPMSPAPAEYAEDVSISSDPVEISSPEEEAIWAEQVESWFAPATTTPAPVPSVPALSHREPAREDNPRTSSAYPPCKACGKIRTIMLVMKATDLEAAGTLCSRCYRGERVTA